MSAHLVLLEAVSVKLDTLGLIALARDPAPPVVVVVHVVMDEGPTSLIPGQPD